MSSILILFGLLGTLLIGAMSPGPSFVLVSRIAITSSRASGLAAAVGMGLGGMIFGTLALGGLTALLLQVGWLYFSLKILGGAYLVYLGVMIWRGAADPLIVPEAGTAPSRSLFRSFLLGMTTQLANPKTAIFYASIFAALLPASPPLWMLLVLPPLIFAVEMGWYTVVAIAFSASAPRSVYLGWKAWIDRMAGAVMGALGARLIIESVETHSA
jgi:threonine/homoserine/homoserine lactone efflux protein